LCRSTTVAHRLLPLPKRDLVQSPV
jgi:hypothetical protein